MQVIEHNGGAVVVGAGEIVEVGGRVYHAHYRGDIPPELPAEKVEAFLASSGIGAALDARNDPDGKIFAAKARGVRRFDQMQAVLDYLENAAPSLRATAEAWKAAASAPVTSRPVEWIQRGPRDGYPPKTEVTYGGRLYRNDSGKPNAKPPTRPNSGWTDLGPAPAQ